MNTVSFTLVRNTQDRNIYRFNINVRKTILHDIFVTDYWLLLHYSCWGWGLGLVGGCVEAGGNRDNQQVRLTARYDGHKLPRHIRSTIFCCKWKFWRVSVMFLIFIRGAELTNRPDHLEQPELWLCPVVCSAEWMDCLKIRVHGRSSCRKVIIVQRSRLSCAPCSSVLKK